MYKKTLFHGRFGVQIVSRYLQKLSTGCRIIAGEVFGAYPAGCAVFPGNLRVLAAGCGGLGGKLGGRGQKLEEEGGDVVEGEGFLDGDAAVAGAAEAAEEGAAAQGFAQVARQGPDVGPLGAVHPDHRRRQVVG